MDDAGFIDAISISHHKGFGDARPRGGSDLNRLLRHGLQRFPSAIVHIPSGEHRSDGRGAAVWPGGQHLILERVPLTACQALFRLRQYRRLHRETGQREQNIAGGRRGQIHRPLAGIKHQHPDTPGNAASCRNGVRRGDHTFDGQSAGPLNANGLAGVRRLQRRKNSHRLSGVLA
ncbi:MAG: hypothetical protein BWY83_02743 [bacterium ADurb.Bin478]|nr:MAG: hypothetical protein BWY83_02743 [bacterium ADurb.Bin478]